MNIHKDKIVAFVRKGKVVTSSEVAEFLEMSWNTAESYLKDLVIDNKLERIKKKGVTLWMIK
ncbi:MAG: FaeA/PapI family transcriptional regulator [Nanoarchaeota archaeon]